MCVFYILPSLLDTIQDFFCKLGMKSHTQLNSGSHHLLTHSIYYIIYFAALFCNKTTWNIIGMIKMIQGGNYSRVEAIQGGY